jgi:energy-coupling factor transporter transmembrane protein EcfT
VARLGPVSSFDPACRLVCLALLSSASLFSGALFASLLAIVAVFLLVGEGLSPGSLLRESLFVAFFALLSAALRFVGQSHMDSSLVSDALLYGLRLLAAFLAGRLFYASTTVSELRDAATRITRLVPFARRMDIGLGLSMVIGFIPLVFEEWRSSLEAARSRGMARRQNLSRIAIVVTAFLRRLMLRAVATPEALVARGWTRDRGIAPSRWRARDTLALVVCSFLAIAAMLHVV